VCTGAQDAAGHLGERRGLEEAAERQVTRKVSRMRDTSRWRGASGAQGEESSCGPIWPPAGSTPRSSPQRAASNSSRGSSGREGASPAAAVGSPGSAAPAVHLAVLGERQGGEEDEGGRHHVGRERPFDLGAEAGGGRRRSRPRHHIGDQPPIARRDLAHDDGALAISGWRRGSPRSRPAQCGSRGSSPAGRSGRGTRGCRPAGSGPGRRSCRGALRRRRARSARPSGRDAPDSHGRGRRRRSPARRVPRPEPAGRPGPGGGRRCCRSAGQWGPTRSPESALPAFVAIQMVDPSVSRRLASSWRRDVLSPPTCAGRCRDDEWDRRYAPQLLRTDREHHFHCCHLDGDEGGQQRSRGTASVPIGRPIGQHLRPPPGPGRPAGSGRGTRRAGDRRRRPRPWLSGASRPDGRALRARRRRRRLYKTGDWSATGRTAPSSSSGRIDQQVKIRASALSWARSRRASPASPRSRRAPSSCARSRRAIGGWSLVVARPGASPTRLRPPRRDRTDAPGLHGAGRLRLLPRLPLTENGKVDRRALPEPGLPTAAAGRRPPGRWIPARSCSPPSGASFWASTPQAARSAARRLLRLGGHSLSPPDWCRASAKPSGGPAARQPLRGPDARRDGRPHPGRRCTPGPSDPRARRWRQEAEEAPACFLCPGAHLVPRPADAGERRLQRRRRPSPHRGARSGAPRPVLGRDRAPHESCARSSPWPWAGRARCSSTASASPAASRPFGLGRRRRSRGARPRGRLGLQPFDLAVGPLLCTTLLDVGPGEHLLVVVSITSPPTAGR